MSVIVLVGVCLCPGYFISPDFMLLMPLAFSACTYLATFSVIVGMSVVAYSPASFQDQHPSVRHCGAPPSMAGGAVAIAMLATPVGLNFELLQCGPQ